MYSLIIRWLIAVAVLLQEVTVTLYPGKKNTPQLKKVNKVLIFKRERALCLTEYVLLPSFPASLFRREIFSLDGGRFFMQSDQGTTFNRF
jgi:hypothetical protein